jgi:hypothetical protein
VSAVSRDEKEPSCIARTAPVVRARIAEEGAVARGASSWAGRSNPTAVLPPSRRHRATSRAIR